MSSAPSYLPATRSSQTHPELDALPSENLRRLHRGTIDDRGAVVRLLQRAARAGCEFHNGVDRKSVPRTGRVQSVSSDRLTLRAPNIRAGNQPQIYLHFDLGTSRYFFAAPPIGGGGDAPLALELPEAIYEAERRDLLRSRPASGKPAPRMLIRPNSGNPTIAEVRDWSYQGVGLSVPAASEASDRSVLELEYMDGEHAGEVMYGSVRYRRPDPLAAERTHIGLEVSQTRPADPFPVERRESILEGGVGQRAWRRVRLATAIARALPSQLADGAVGRVLQRRLRPTVHSEPEVVRYANDRGEEITALLDRAGSGAGGTAIVIPPAWGRTKETFLPLARTLAATFERAGESAVVLRFDGTHRRGESYIDPSFRASGDEYLNFRFSQAVEDIRSSFDWLENDSGLAPENIVLVTFSLGAVEGRRALALEAQEGLDRVCGWVAVVGMVDLQSGLRTVSGGVDFAYGQARGLSFGRHELVGVRADMDLTGADAFEHNLVFLEDAKRDMAGIEIPVTWLHGRHDAWMELDRVRAMLAAGPDDERKLIEIPAGHQMRSSREALQTFQLVSQEAFRMARGKTIEPALPSLGELAARNEAERTRRPPPDIDLPAFWSDYLLGRDRRLGFELLSATTAYRQLMSLQTERLDLASGHHTLDLGAGNGDFAVHIADALAQETPGTPSDLTITQVDLVPGALARGRTRMAERGNSPQLEILRLAANLECDGRSIPLRDECADSVLSSLVLSYVEDPSALLREMHRVLRPGGRLVLSSMRRDADISRIYVDSIAELPPDRRRKHFGVESAEDFEELQRVFLNDAARLIQLEEDGRFHFWDGEELADLCRQAGFKILSVDAAFGDPPQAVIATAVRP